MVQLCLKHYRSFFLTGTAFRKVSAGSALCHLRDSETSLLTLPSMLFLSYFALNTEDKVKKPCTIKKT